LEISEEAKEIGGEARLEKEDEGGVRGTACTTKREISFSLSLFLSFFLSLLSLDSVPFPDSLVSKWRLI